jgi:hypothetical protein
MENKIKILMACEESGECRRAFRDRGFDAWSCDLQPASDGDSHHLQCDVFDVLGDGWDAMLAFWPCTRLCNSGVRWLHERDLWAEMEHSAQKFRRLLEFHDIQFRAMENPIPHKYALDIIGSRYDQIIQPWQFGHGETKATCLWLRNLPKLRQTDVVAGRDHRIHRLPPTKDRGRIRSKTYPGIASAMAQQWGDWIMTHIEPSTQRLTADDAETLFSANESTKGE